MLGVTFVLTLETVMKACLAYTRDQNQRYLTNNLSPVDVRVNQPVGVDCSVSLSNKWGVCNVL
jgi:hypothetical protein